MIDEEVPLAPRDHNQPPSLVEALVLEQKEALEPYTQRRDELTASAARVKIFDRISAGDAGDVIRIAGDVFKLIDADRMARTNPYRNAADAAKGAVDEFWQPVLDALTELRGRLKAWTDAEDDRIAKQQREQEEAMRQMRAASNASTGIADAADGDTAPVRSAAVAPPPRMQPAYRRKIRGDLGATVSTVEKAQYRVSDIKLVPEWILATPTVHEAIVSVVKSMAKHTGDIPGIERTTFTDNQIR